MMVIWFQLGCATEKTVIMKWKDKNDIHLASATHYGEMVPTGIQD
jgi:hypothetical protein